MSSHHPEAIAGIKEKIATSTRILVRERLIGPFGHPSTRIPGTDLVAVLGHTHDDVKDLAETDTEDVVVMDLDGEVVEGTMEAPGERFMHTEIYKARPDVGAVIHAHPMHCIAFSITDVPLAPVWHLCTLFADGVPIYDSAVQIDNPERGRSVAAALGDRKGVLLKGHGLTVVGTSIEEATVSAVNLERSARLQIMAGGLGAVEAIDRAELTGEMLTDGLTLEEYTHTQWDYWAMEIG
ncbi:MAG: class II aldolase/adducin family protein [Acidimicrobiia bacterium]|nr:class II aldolase/adducin family protein [Acidimicrobiia bacterium]MCY4432352.1 class II aldolase/adducin family protein [bacterium]